MIPRDFIYKYMFIYLYDFANGKILLYILGLYIVQKTDELGHQ